MLSPIVVRILKILPDDMLVKFAKRLTDGYINKYANLTVNGLENIDEKLNGLKKEISPMAEKYFGRTDQEAFILYIHDLNNKSGLNITKVAFSDEINVNLSQALEENGEETTKEETKDTADGNLAVYELNELDDTSVANDDAKYSQNIKLMKAEIEFIGTDKTALMSRYKFEKLKKYLIPS